MATTKKPASSNKRPDRKRSSTTTSKRTSTTQANTAATQVTSEQPGNKTHHKVVANDSPQTGTASLAIVRIVLAEIVGTFVLTTVALLSLGDVMPLYVGLTLAVLVLAIGAISGAHVNPAVTFGLWTAGKVKSLLVPFYWAAQFIGAMAAVVLINSLTGNKFGLSFEHFTQFSWQLFSIELVGTAIFLFGLSLVLGRVDLSATGKAFGVGASLLIGVLVGASLLAQVQTNADTSNVTASVDEKTGAQVYSGIPRELHIRGATLNPAVALASTEKSQEEIASGRKANGETANHSRLGVEVIAATMVGAALGANAGRFLGRRYQA